MIDLAKEGQVMCAATGFLAHAFLVWPSPQVCPASFAGGWWARNCHWLILCALPRQMVLKQGPASRQAAEEQRIFEEVCFAAARSINQSIIHS